MNKSPLSQSDLDMHSYIDSKQTNQQGFNSLPRFLPLGMMFTEEASRRTSLYAQSVNNSIGKKVQFGDAIYRTA